MPDLLPLAEAAEYLGVSVDAVRKKIRRDTIKAEKRGDRWYVEVPDRPTAGVGDQDEGYDMSSRVHDDQITRELVDLLRAELEAKNDQIARLTALLGNAQQTVQLLTASAGQQAESHVPARGEDGARERVEPVQRPAPGGLRAWWRRLSGIAE